MSGKNKALSFVVFASHSARLECLHLTNTSPMLQKLCRLFQTRKPAIENGLRVPRFNRFWSVGSERLQRYGYLKQRENLDNIFSSTSLAAREDGRTECCEYRAVHDFAGGRAILINDLIPGATSPKIFESSFPSQMLAIRPRRRIESDLLGDGGVAWRISDYLTVCDWSVALRMRRKVLIGHDSSRHSSLSRDFRFCCLWSQSPAKFKTLLYIVMQSS